jgi:hypothetical protein
MEGIFGILIPGALALAGVALTQVVNRRKQQADTGVQIIGVLQTERTAADNRADRAEKRAWLLEDYAGRLRRLMFAADLDVPPWPPAEEKVPS